LRSQFDLPDATAETARKGTDNDLSVISGVSYLPTECNDVFLTDSVSDLICHIKGRKQFEVV
jgi:hypothetical protein